MVERFKAGPKPEFAGEKRPDGIKTFEEKLVDGAKTFDALYETIEKIGPVKGSRETFAPERLKRLIEEYREDGRSSIAITRTHGIRAKAIELLREEAIENPSRRY
ncbi:Uncharacterised protein [uncultured archaeon]|nr:Uncharacterised protein [uncultured archaeon]